VSFARALDALLRRRGLADLSLFARLEQRWDEVVGMAAASRSRPWRLLEGGTLVVQTDGPELASELRIQAEEVLARARDVSGLGLRELRVRVARDVL
jgi:predicted nucleic acid-binding Zn ribbon protein